jgi:chitinase
MLALVIFGLLWNIAAARNVGYVNNYNTLDGQCDSANFDTLILAFVDTFSASGLIYTLDGVCTTGGINCETLKATVARCQKNGKTIMISMGGANGVQSFSVAGAAVLAQDVFQTFFQESGPIGKLDGLGKSLYVNFYQVVLISIRS